MLARPPGNGRGPIQMTFGFRETRGARARCGDVADGRNGTQVAERRAGLRSAVRVPVRKGVAATSRVAAWTRSGAYLPPDIAGTAGGGVRRVSQRAPTTSPPIRYASPPGTHITSPPNCWSCSGSKPSALVLSMYDGYQIPGASVSSAPSALGMNHRREKRQQRVRAAFAARRIAEHRPPEHQPLTRKLACSTCGCRAVRARLRRMRVHARPIASPHAASTR